MKKKFYLEVQLSEEMNFDDAEAAFKELQSATACVLTNSGVYIPTAIRDYSGWVKEKYELEFKYLASDLYGEYLLTLNIS